MELKEFAKLLDNRQYGNEITKEEEQLAKGLGFVVVFGYSDDCVELRGAIDDELDCYGGGYVEHELLPEKLLVEWNPDSPDCAWAYAIPLPYETFNIYEGEELYCVGIVCDINTRPKPMTNGDRIRAMSDEELAEFLSDKPWKCKGQSCRVCNRYVNKTCISVDEWLKQPVEVEHGG